MEWRAEPFRIFFPLGVLLGCAGVGQWLLYGTGATATYSCPAHGAVQTQGFMMAFAVGFLLTALPRRTGTAPPGRLEMGGAAAALLLTTGAALDERWALSETAYLFLLLLVLRFALVRFSRPAKRRPPAAFVLIPLAILHGVLGAALLIAAAVPGGPVGTVGLGRLLVEQGVFLCLLLGVGGLILPLVAGLPAPPDLSATRIERLKVIGYAGAGGAVFVSLLLEHAGWMRAGPMLRAAAIAAGLASGGAWRPPRRPGLHRRLVWLAAWLAPLGIAVAGLLPAYRVPALHILFIGGFSLLAFGVATHVTLGHLGLESLALGHPPAVVVLGAAFVLAMLARAAADWSETYFAHLGWAAGAWLVGAAVWLAFFGSKLLRR
jgi:uncharacterized protein involved in response to NO